MDKGSFARREVQAGPLLRPLSVVSTPPVFREKGLRLF
jgi:hypothetical protein